MMTVDEFFELPEPVGEFICELHFGELVQVPRAKKGRYELQVRIRDLLAEALGLKRWLIQIEVPYGLAVGNDVRWADVAVVLRERWDAVLDDDYLIGSPDFILLTKVRSNMEEDAIVHITHGATAVLLVRPERREIVMVTASSRTVYGPGERIELPAPLSTAIAIDDVFPAA